MRFKTDFATSLVDDYSSIPVYFASGSRIKVLGIWEQQGGGFYVSISRSIGFSDTIEENQFEVEME